DFVVIDMLGYCFFFQAEVGIRDGHVSEVQTCALPILQLLPGAPGSSCTKNQDRVSLELSSPPSVTTGRSESRCSGCSRFMRLSKIGRASCRERVEVEWGERGVKEQGEAAGAG